MEVPDVSAPAIAHRFGCSAAHPFAGIFQLVFRSILLVTCGDDTFSRFTVVVGTARLG